MSLGRGGANAPPPRTVLYFLGFAALVLVVSCSEEANAPVSPERKLSTSSTPPNEQLARALALALNKPNLRNSLLHGFQSSPVEEGKVHLEIYLGGVGRAFLPSIAEAGDMTPDEILALVEALPSMEIYLPVPEHRKQWRGGKDLLVATMMVDGDPPIGFNLEGERLSLSASESPDVPTIVLVQAESFDADGRPRGRALRRAEGRSLAPACSPSEINCGDDGSGGGGWNFPSGAVHRRNVGVREFIAAARFFNDHEGWGHGRPEFFLLFAGTRDTDSAAEFMIRVNIPDRTWSDGTDEWQGYKLTDPPINTIDHDQDLGTRIQFRCMEDDGWDFAADATVSGSTDIQGQVNVQFSGTFQVSTEDDNCGSNTLNMQFSDGTIALIPDGPGGEPIEFDGTSSLQWWGYGLPLN